MKKIVMMLLVLASMSVKVNAQWYVSGVAGLGYWNDSFQMELLPSAGYEINDRWAVACGLGLGVTGGWAYGIIDPYARFNCWNNKRFFVDAKAESEIWFGHGNSSANIGFVPSLRCVVKDHWQVSADVGLIGVQCFNDEWHPAFGFTSANVKMSLIYKF